MPTAVSPPNGEPLSPRYFPRPTPPAFGQARCLGFEYASRGDRVPGRLLLPPSGGDPFPLILLEHGLGGSKDSPYLDCAARWVDAGAAVASIDLPLHGERQNPKLSPRLAASALPDATEPRDEVAQLLLATFAQQTVTDLTRCLDTLTQHEAIDASRSAFAAFSLGAIVGTLFCAQDTRPRAAALALAGGGFGPPELDPCRHIAAIAPRPVLLVNAKRDERIPESAASALHDAAREPKTLAWFDCGHRDLPGEALKTLWDFLAAAIELR